MAFNGLVLNAGTLGVQGKQLFVDGYFDAYSSAINAGTVTLQGGIQVTRQSPGLFTVALPFVVKQHNGIQVTLCEFSASNRIAKVVGDTITVNGKFQILTMNTTTGTAADLGPADYVSFLVCVVNSQVIPLSPVQVV